MKKYVDVILPLPLNGTYTYAVPDDLSLSVGAGCRVVVPLGKRSITQQLSAMCIIVRLRSMK